MLQWIRTEASGLGFSVVTETYDNGSNIRLTFMTMRREEMEST